MSERVDHFVEAMWLLDCDAADDFTLAALWNQRAQAYATLALVEATDRQTEQVRRCADAIWQMHADGRRP